jgi:DamX protein
MQLDIPYSAPEPLADYHQHYGLASDPFSDDPEFPFFGGGQRRLLLEHLLEQTQSSSSLLAVLGPTGVGKTRMAHALVQAFSGEQNVCHVKAQPGYRAEQILGDISRSFGITGAALHSEGQILVGLRSFIQSSDDSDGLILLVVDDAHHLDEQTLGALLSLLQGQGGARRLHMVFFALPELVDHLDRFGMHDVPVYDLYLEPLSLTEATDYLNFRLEMADYLGPELFNEARVDPWWRQSAGDLTRLHDCAHQWLMGSATPVASAACHFEFRGTGRGNPHGRSNDR